MAQQLTADHLVAVLQSKGEEIYDFDDFVGQTLDENPVVVAPTTAVAAATTSGASSNPTCRLNEKLGGNFNSVEFSFQTTGPGAIQCTARYNKHCVHGLGASRQSAKHDACRKILEILEPQANLKKTTAGPVPQEDGFASGCSNNQADPVSRLNSLCQRNKQFGKPDFSTDQNNDGTYSVTATVTDQNGELHAIGGSSKKKKTAKQMAAEKMLKLIFDKHQIK